MRANRNRGETTRGANGIRGETTRIRPYYLFAPESESIRPT